jgi:hypothetical protein
MGVLLTHKSPNFIALHVTDRQVSQFGGEQRFASLPGKLH